MFWKGPGPGPILGKLTHSCASRMLLYNAVLLAGISIPFIPLAPSFLSPPYKSHHCYTLCCCPWQIYVQIASKSEPELGQFAASALTPHANPELNLQRTIRIWKLSPQIFITNDTNSDLANRKRFLLTAGIMYSQE